jgi:predicted enzyme related to lactoylglutathione lyase
MADQPNDIAERVLPAQGDFVWTEVACNDADKCAEFYRNVFGWTFKKGGAAADGLDYREFSTGGDHPAGGLYQINPEWFGGNPPPAHILNFIAVDDVDKTAELAAELGANVHKTIDIPNVGRMSIVQDPTGAMFATFKPKN